jgi:hypothetical protein
MRCEHGFLRTVVKCPECDGDRGPKRWRSPEAVARRAEKKRRKIRTANTDTRPGA